MTLILKFLPPPPLRLNKNFQHIILGKEQRRKKVFDKRKLKPKWRLVFWLLLFKTQNFDF